MKKIAIMALLAFVSAGFSTANAQSRKEKKQKKQEQIESIAITTVRSIKRTASRLYTWTERRYFKT